MIQFCSDWSLGKAEGKWVPCNKNWRIGDHTVDYQLLWRFQRVSYLTSIFFCSGDLHLISRLRKDNPSHKHSYKCTTLNERQRKNLLHSLDLRPTSSSVEHYDCMFLDLWVQIYTSFSFGAQVWLNYITGFSSPPTCRWQIMRSEPSKLHEPFPEINLLLVPNI